MTAEYTLELRSRDQDRRKPQPAEDKNPGCLAEKVYSESFQMRCREMRRRLLRKRSPYSTWDGRSDSKTPSATRSVERRAMRSQRLVQRRPNGPGRADAHCVRAAHRDRRFTLEPLQLIVQTPRRSTKPLSIIEVHCRLGRRSPLGERHLHTLTSGAAPAQSTGSGPPLAPTCPETRARASRARATSAGRCGAPPFPS